MDSRCVRDGPHPTMPDKGSAHYGFRLDYPNDRWTARAGMRQVGEAYDPAMGFYDRRVTSALWNYDYIWEVYTPPTKRKRGYYALPVLAGTELVGHVEPKADRPARQLRVISRSIKRGHKTAVSVGKLALWLGLS